MSSGVQFSLYGLYIYSDRAELDEFRTFLTQINSSPEYSFLLAEKQYRTVFNEKLDLPNREIRLLQNMLFENVQAPKGLSDFYEGQKWILRFYESTAMTGNQDVNSRSVVESICDDCVTSWLCGLGFVHWESIHKEGYAYRSSEGIETFLYSLSIVIFS